MRNVYFSVAFMNLLLSVFVRLKKKHFSTCNKKRKKEMKNGKYLAV